MSIREHAKRVFSSISSRMHRSRVMHRVKQFVAASVLVSGIAHPLSAKTGMYVESGIGYEHIVGSSNRHARTYISISSTSDIYVDKRFRCGLQLNVGVNAIVDEKPVFDVDFLAKIYTSIKKFSASLFAIGSKHLSAVYAIGGGVCTQRVCVGGRYELAKDPAGTPMGPHVIFLNGIIPSKHIVLRPQVMMLFLPNGKITEGFMLSGGYNMSDNAQITFSVLTTLKPVEDRVSKLDALLGIRVKF